MSQDFPQLTARLEEDLAAERIPASRIDLERACRDGYRARRKRRALTTATGAGVAGLCAALAVTVLPGERGGRAHEAVVGTAPSWSSSAPSASPSPAPSNGLLPMPTATAPTSAGSGPGTDPVTVTASFGWLPQNVDYIITGPYGGGETAFSARASGYIPGGSGPSAGQASVFLTLASQNPAKTVDPSLHLVAGPKVGGAQGYWITASTADLTNAGDPTLEWQAAPGQWATVDASDMGGDPLLSTVEHIAQTVHVGSTELPLPVQIKGLSGVAGVNQIVLTRPVHSTDSDDWQLFTSFNLVSASGNAHESMYITAQGTDTGSLTGVGPASPGTTSDCKTTGDIAYCATTTYTGDTTGLPSAKQLLGEVTILGNDQSAWRSDLLVQQP